jgi:hypothetical protein
VANGGRRTCAPSRKTAGPPPAGRQGHYGADRLLRGAVCSVLDELETLGILRLPGRRRPGANAARGHARCGRGWLTEGFTF